MSKQASSLSPRDLCHVSIGAALIAVCSWLSIPLTVPFTLQSFAVCLLAALLGWKRGVLAVLVYMLLGAAGLPVFSGFRGGIAVLLGMTGGYIAGFLLTALVTGLAAERRADRPLPLLLAMALGMLLCYLCGTVWFMLVYSRGSGAIGLLGALNLCVFPFLLPDAVKCLLAFLLARRLRPFLTKAGCSHAYQGRRSCGTSEKSRTIPLR